MQFSKSRSMMWGAVAVMSVVILSSCLKSVQPTPPAATTYLSVMHLANSAPAVETYFDDEKVSQPLTSGTYFTVYSGVNPGAFGIKFKKAGSDSVVASIPLNSYDSLKYHTLLVYDNFGGGGASALRIRDDFSVLTSIDKSYIRFFHVSPDLMPVDVYIDNNVVFSGRQYMDNLINDSYNAFIPTNPGYNNIQVKKAGSDSLIFQTTNNFVATNAYTIFTHGTKDGTGSKALATHVLQARN